MEKTKSNKMKDSSIEYKECTTVYSSCFGESSVLLHTLSDCFCVLYVTC